MEACVFRFLARELAALLAGRSARKIFEPRESLFTLDFGPHESGRFLIFRPAKSAGLVFFTDKRPDNPPKPTARAMWLRKRLSGHRLGPALIDWPALAVALPLAGGKAGWCVLDLRRGIEVVPEPPPLSDAEPEWPEVAAMADEPDIWREYPHVSPALRRLAVAHPERAAQVRQALIHGRPDGFYLHLRQGAPPRLLLWPDAEPGVEVRRFDSALEAAGAMGKTALSGLGAAEHAERRKFLARAEKKRLSRNLARTARDRERHLERIGRRQWAEALQAHLHTLGRDRGRDRVDVPLAGGESLHVPLDPALSPAENMARYFRQAAKAERGLAATADRLAGLESELAALERGSAPPEPRPGLGAKARPAPDKALPRKLRGLAVAVFRTTDGFTVLRAKNAQAGHGLVARAAAPHDYWFHAADGPGAHVILRRDSPAALVPESSLVQAAQLAALKSWRSEDATAEVHMALAGDVRMAKGGKTGLAILDKVEQTLKVELDPSLEERLAAR